MHIEWMDLANILRRAAERVDNEITSCRSLLEEAHKALRLVDEDVRHHHRCESDSAALIRPHAIKAVRFILGQIGEPKTGKLCTFGPPEERKRLWLVKFEDEDIVDGVFENEGDARTYFENASITYNCTLFMTAESDT